MDKCGQVPGCHGRFPLAGCADSQGARSANNVASSTAAAPGPDPWLEALRPRWGHVCCLAGFELGYR